MKTFRGKFNASKDKIDIHFWCPISQFEELTKVHERREPKLPKRLQDNFSETLRYIVALGLAEDRRRNQHIIDTMKNGQDNGTERPSVVYKGVIPIIEGIKLIEHD